MSDGNRRWCRCQSKTEEEWCALMKTSREMKEIASLKIEWIEINLKQQFYILRAELCTGEWERKRRKNFNPREASCNAWKLAHLRSLRHKREKKEI